MVGDSGEDEVVEGGSEEAVVVVDVSIPDLQRKLFLSEPSLTLARRTSW